MSAGQTWWDWAFGSTPEDVEHAVVTAEDKHAEHLDVLYRRHAGFSDSTIQASSDDASDEALWGKLEQYQTPGATASALYIPLLHAVFSKPSMDAYQRNVQAMLFFERIFALWEKWKAALKAHELIIKNTTQGVQLLHKLNTEGYINGPAQVWLLKIGGINSQELILSIHAVLNDRKQKKTKWPCPACTFDNNAHSEKCQMCAHARP
jgi:hypothetical protein